MYFSENIAIKCDTYREMMYLKMIAEAEGLPTGTFTESCFSSPYNLNHFRSHNGSFGMFSAPFLEESTPFKDFMDAYQPRNVDHMPPALVPEQSVILDAEYEMSQPAQPPTAECLRHQWMDEVHVMD